MERTVRVLVDWLPAFDHLVDDRSRTILLKGGAGSGKSHFMHAKAVYRAMTEPGHRFLFVRKVARTLRNSVFQLINDLNRDMIEGANVVVNKTEMRFTYPTGSEIICVGIDDPEKIKSVVGITGIFVEECTELDRMDWMQLNARLRGKQPEGGYPQMMGAFNPVIETHWIKAEFFDTPRDGVTTHESNYRDNPHLPESYVQSMERDAATDENFYRVYVLNQWGKPTTGMEFYKSFSIGRHVFDLTEEPGQPLHFAVDFNLNPGMHAIVSHIEGRRVDVIECIRAIAPNNSSHGIAKEFCEMHKHRANRLVYLYGDASGMAGDTRSRTNDFDIIRGVLETEGFEVVYRIPRANPAVQNRGQWLSGVLGGVRSVVVRINRTAAGLIEDMSYTKIAADGGKHKQKVRDPETKITYEKYGHYSDAFDYLMCEAFSDDYAAHLAGKVYDETEPTPSPFIGRRPSLRH